MADDLWGDLGYKAPAQAQTGDAPPVAADPALKALVASKAAQYGIPADIADRWVQAESSYNPKATSKKGARGLTQLMPKTAEAYGVDDVEDPDKNVEGGTHYLADLKQQFGSWDKALAAYNAGPDAVTKAGGVPNIPETQKYVNDILGDHAVVGSGDLWSQLGYKPGAKAADDAPETGQFVSYKDVSPKQQAFYAQQTKGGLHDETAPVGDERHPYFETTDHPLKATPPGAFVVDANGVLHKMPGGAKDSSFAAGLGQGVGDVAASLSHLAPGSDDSQIKNALLAEQQIYAAKYGGDLKSGAGRFTGQLVGSAPLLVGGGEVAAPALKAAGPVGEFLAGQAGKGAAGLGGRLLRGGSLAAGGAATGAGAAGLTSSANEGSAGQQMAEGAAGGALLGPAAPIVEGAGAAVAKGAKALVEPLTAQGPAKIANRIVGAFHAGSVGKADASELVPGSVPTLSQATADPGVATLERTVRMGEHGPAFTARDEANKTARATFLDTVRGDRQRIADLEDARDTATAGARDAALKSQTKPADIKPVLDAIDTMLKGPEGKQKEVAKALTAVRENLHDAAGNPETSAEMLYGVRKDLNDLLSPKASSERKGAQLATSQLIKVRGLIDGAIQDVAPGFKEYLKTYADMSKPINEASWLQQQKMLDVNGHPTLAKVQGALDRIEAAKAKPGANDAKSISDDTVVQLKALRDDLKRAGNLTLQKPGGSDTAQHLTTGGRLAQAGVPVAGLAALAHHPLVAAAVGGGKLLYGMKDKQIMGEVANRLLNPAPVVRQVVRQAKPGPIKRLTAPVVPAVGGMLANRLAPAQ